MMRGERSLAPSQSILYCFCPSIMFYSMQWNTHSRRVWPTRYRGHDACNQVGKGAATPFPGDMSWIPSCCHWVGSKCLWSCQYVDIHWPRSLCLTSCAIVIEATSGEFQDGVETDDAFIIFMPEGSRTHMGGTMRLGLRPTVFTEGAQSWSKVKKLYGGAPKIWERHRHRYEVNPQYVKKLEDSGMCFVGKDEKGERMQILELPGLFSIIFASRMQLIVGYRTSIFRGTSGTSWVLLAAIEPIAILPRLCGRSFW